MAKAELIAGYQRFHSHNFRSTNFKTLVEQGQSPECMIIACSDSRVDPAIVTDADAGDIFVVRNVANLVPPYEAGKEGLHGVSAAIEFGVKVLKVKDLIVMGHRYCAGISALLNPESVQDTDFIGPWVNVAEPAKAKTLALNPTADQHIHQHLCEKESILLSLENLMTFPWVRTQVEKKLLKLSGWYLHLDSLSLEEYDIEKGRFEFVPVNKSATGT